MSENAVVVMSPEVRSYIDEQIQRSVAGLLTPGFKLFAEHANLIPKYNKVGDSGFDLRANIATDIFIQPGDRALVPTGLYVEMPVGFELQIRPRSGYALKEGATVLNAPGTIDANYRGQIGVIVHNDGSAALHIQPFERVAQGVVARVERINWELVESREALTETERGEGGFGSSGKQ